MVTKTLLQAFVQDNGLQSLGESVAFEHFAGTLVTQSHVSDSVTPEDIAVGMDGNDSAIDSIAVIINGTLITEPEEVEDLASLNGYLDVVFVLTQAKRSAEFDGGGMGHFASGVLDFFSERPRLVQNDRVQHYALIAKTVFRWSKLFGKGNPQCHLYYVTTGKWTDDQNLTAVREAARTNVESLRLFRKVSFDCVDAERLQKLYRESQNSRRTEITFAQRTVLPDMPGVEQAYLGLLPATEFLKLIENDNHEVLTSLFYDNVRHWLDWNTVNEEIGETLADPEKSRYFPLLNNGVTIIAKSMNPTGNKLLLEDYQIANGCQTSFVLHEKRNNITGLGEDVMVPVRIIATRDDNIRNAIIKATNRQTAVTDDQFFALTEFPKRLEAFFPSYDGKRRLFYERRARQYSGQPGVEKVRVITQTILVRAFASMFLGSPHRTTRNYKALLKSVGSDIFNKEHRLEPYYVAAYAHYRLDFLFRNQILDARLKPARYHLLLAFRTLVHSGKLPRMNSHDMKKLCDRLAEALWNDDRSKELFEQAAEYVERVAAGNMHRDNIRSEPFTKALKAALRS